MDRQPHHPIDEHDADGAQGRLWLADAERAEHLVATGYLAVGSKSHNLRGRPQFQMDLADEQIKARILLRRYGQALDVANAVWFLASRYADYITGEVLHVDGGFKME